MGVTSTVETALELAVVHNHPNGLESVLSHKASTTLAIICSEIFDQLNALLGRNEGDQCLEKILSRALVQLSKEALGHRPLSVLISSRLLPRAPVNSLASPSPNSDLPVGSSPFIHSYC